MSSYVNYNIANNQCIAISVDEIEMNSKQSKTLRLFEFQVKQYTCEDAKIMIVYDKKITKP